MLVIKARRLRQGFPSLHRHFAVGLGRERKNHFGGVDIGVDAGETFGRALLRDLAIKALKQVNFVFGVPGNTFHRVAELLHQRAERGEALVDVGIVPLDHGDRRHGLAGDRLDLTFLPIFHIERLRDFPGKSCWMGVSTTSFSTPRISGAISENFLAIAL